jgi:hypothetical protein
VPVLPIGCAPKNACADSNIASEQVRVRTH